MSAHPDRHSVRASVAVVAADIGIPVHRLSERASAAIHMFVGSRRGAAVNDVETPYDGVMEPVCTGDSLVPDSVR